MAPVGSVGSVMTVVHPFTAEGEGELTVAQNSRVTVLEAENPSNAGWLLVRAEDGRTGYVPLDFLAPVAQPQTEAQPSFRQQAASRMSVAMPPAAIVQQHGQDIPPVWGQPAYAQPASNGFGDAWVQRDSVFGSFVRTPIPPQRRWYYRDIFGDMQGPFNVSEMRQRVDARHIQSETICVCEVGSGAVQRHEERALRELFPTLDVAFLQPAVLGGSKSFWYYLDDARVEQGPFSNDQMRLWFDVEGYFGSTSQVREAVPGSTYAPLRQVFPDPTTAFLGGSSAQRSQQQQQQPAYDQTSFQIFEPPVLSKQTSQSSSSSRQLLQAALTGKDLPPPPAALGKVPSGKQMAMEEDEDDTLALFDKIGLANDEPPKKGSASPAVVMKIYGTPGIWPEWKGVPNLKAKPDAFPTALYHFFTRPLNPNAGKILSHITREIDGIGHFNYNKFVLYLENETGPQPTAVAFRHNGPMSTTFDIKLLTNARVDDTRSALTIAKMEVNFMGTTFLVHNSVPGHQGKAKDLCCILYEATRMGKGGPRRMRVGIPDLEDGKPEFKTFVHGMTGSESMLTALQHINAKNLIPMLNKPPKWNAAKNAYSLDFGGRVTRASVKNFQLVDALHDPEHSNVILQHGRVAEDKFTMDVQHPMSLLQAFAVCLSSLHQKKAVD